jgi:hypothetical protein
LLQCSETVVPAEVELVAEARAPAVAAATALTLPADASTLAAASGVALRSL